MNNIFKGWYFRVQDGEKTLAIIPSLHLQKNGSRQCYVQAISEEGTWSAAFSDRKSVCDERRPYAKIQRNLFTPEGIFVDIDSPELAMKGKLSFGAPTLLRYDIMGPFCFMPGMECRHMVFSMRHSVNGIMSLNGRDYYFRNAIGYIEGDRGSSFPSEYLWTQCFLRQGSLMLSAAEIPIGPICFTGVIGVVYLRGREYRLASYLGARVKIGSGKITVRQGKYTLIAEGQAEKGSVLHAPVCGSMSRRIRENISCSVRYTFLYQDKILLDSVEQHAAFEYEYHR